MIRRFRRRTPISKTICVLCVICGSNAFAADTNAVLNAWLAAQTNLHTWSADFTQTRCFRMLLQPLVATGHLWFAKSNRFRWELGSPAQTIALRDEKQMWVVYPQLKRAERYPLTGSGSGEWRDMLSLLDAGFAHDRADFDSRFRILSLTQTSNSWLLVVQPRSAGARKMMRELWFGIATNDFSLAMNALVFADGSTLSNDFTNAVANPSLDEKLFEWKPPADFKVTEPLAK